MITTLIDNHLNVLGEGIAKGVALGAFEHIIVSNRANIGKLTRKVELRYFSWNKVLSSEVLIEAVNGQIADDKVLDELCSAKYPAEQIAQVVNLPYLDEIFNKAKAAFEESRNKYYDSKEIPLANWVVDVLLYLATYGYSEETADSAISTAMSIKRHSYLGDDFPNMEPKERVRFMRLYGSAYKKLNNVPHHQEKDFLNRCLVHLDFYEEVHRLVGEAILTKCFQQVQQSLDNSKNRVTMKQHLLSVLFSVDTELSSEWMLQLFGEEHDIVLEEEVSRLATHAASRPSNDVYAVIYGDQSLAYEVIKNWRELSRYQIHLIKDCIQSSKKGFLRLISTNEQAKETFMELNQYTLLYRPEFGDLVNLNTLNEKNLVTLNGMNCDERYLNLLDRKIQLTFDEFQFLYGKEEIDIQLYYHLMPEFSVGERLRVCRELPSMKTVTALFQSKGELFERVAELVKKKTMKQWVAEKKLKLVDSEDKHYLIMLLVPERFEKFKSSIKNGTDVEFVIREAEILAVAESLVEAKLMFLEKNEDCQYLVRELNVSRDFIQKYKVNIVSYYERGLCQIFSYLHNGSKLDEYQKANLNLITKAELTGKLNDLKFVQEDFELEIGLPVSSEVILEWMRNRTASASGFAFSETYDYETTLRLGQYPVATCQHWHNGTHSRCLLSHFDTNKKLLVARGRKNHVLARAILRLTKGAEQFVAKKVKQEKKKLAFKDVEATAQEPEVQNEVKESLVLFLERCYTNMDGQQAINVRREFIRMAKQKADALGALLVIADEYGIDDIEELNDFELKSSYYIFISYSKNGYQYLDSLSGQASEEYEGKYNSAKLLIKKA
jgi:hypothetical protein